MRQVEQQIDPRLTGAWEQRLDRLIEISKLVAECSKLQAKSNELWDKSKEYQTESYKLQAESYKLINEFSKLQDENDKLWITAVRAVYGDIEIKWVWDDDKKSNECHLATGEVFRV